MVLSFVGTSVVMIEEASLAVVMGAEFGEKPIQRHLKLKNGNLCRVTCTANIGYLYQ